MDDIGTIRAYRIDELKSAISKREDFDFYRLEEFTSDIRHLKTPHRHDHFVIFLSTKGRGIHTIDFKKYALKPNRLFLIVPGQIHAWNILRKIEGYVVVFTRAFLSLPNISRDIRELLFHNTKNTAQYLDLSDSLSIEAHAIFQILEREVNNRDRYSYQVIRAYLQVLLLQLARARSTFNDPGREQSLPADKVKEFERSVHKNFKVLRSVSDYAALLHVTPNYLNAICKKVAGKSAGEIIRERLLLEAKRLLANTDVTVAEVAYQLNFEDNSYFGRFFKKNTRQTPAGFREKSRRFDD